MRVEANHGTLLRKLGGAFTPKDADRIAEALKSLTPSKVVVDFTTVREFQDAAFHSLAAALASVPGALVTLRGLPHHQSRVLEYLGVPP
jgi:anti-anti-sigma regulatory factor